MRCAQPSVCVDHRVGGWLNVSWPVTQTYDIFVQELLSGLIGIVSPFSVRCVNAPVCSCTVISPRLTLLFGRRWFFKMNCTAGW